MRKVEGWLSNDDMFFPTAREAAKHDAEIIIIAWCTEKNIDTKKVFAIIEALADPIMEYVNAQDVEIPGFVGGPYKDTKDSKYKTETAQDTNSREVGEDQPNTTGLKALATIFQQSLDGPEPVSDLGSSPRTESVFKHSPRHGTRSR